MLASGGYPWTVIRLEDRDAYLSALDRASIDMDIKPFAAFVAERVGWSLKAESSKKAPSAQRKDEGGPLTSTTLREP
jgi:hypothetical protein